MINPTIWIDLGIAVGAAAAAVLAARTLGPKLAPTLGKAMGEAYQKRLFKQLKAKYPDLIARFAELGPITPEKQERFAATFKRIPPGEGQKIQAEFLRLKDGFMARHPDLDPLLADFQSGEGKRQAKAIQTVLKFPEPKRKALSKDLIWAIDQFQGRFPKWYQALLSTLRSPQPGSPNGAVKVAAKTERKKA